MRHAIEVGRELAKDGHRLAGIRLDSGDLAWLSLQARRMLDEAGLADTAILASNELDEHVIHALAGPEGRRHDLGRGHAARHRLGTTRPWAASTSSRPCATDRAAPGATG